MKQQYISPSIEVDAVSINTYLQPESIKEIGGDDVGGGGPGSGGGRAHQRDDDEEMFEESETNSVWGDLW